MSFSYVSLKPATTGGKKYVAVVKNKATGQENTIRFGAKGYENYTSGHLDEKRRSAYISRHKAKENWTASGANTAGYWAYNYLWRFKTKSEALNSIKSQLK